MSNEEMEGYLNDVVEDLRTGLLNIAEKVRNGSDEDTADAIALMAESICEHWPNCVENEADASQKGTSAT